MRRTFAIELDRGYCTLVDEEDIPLIASLTWFLKDKGNGYVVAAAHIPGTGEGAQAITMHRFLMDPKDGEWIDHANGDTLDNRRSVNLRVCSPAQNAGNRRKHPKSTTGFTGVSYRRDKNLYRAKIGGGRDVVHLGYFKTAEAAARAYDRAAIERYGEFARPNFPQASPKEALHG